jgi:hypothetical protein
LHFDHLERNPEIARQLLRHLDVETDEVAVAVPERERKAVIEVSNAERTSRADAVDQ